MTGEGVESFTEYESMPSIAVDLIPASVMALRTAVAEVAV